MKTIDAFFGSAIATILILLMALVATGCNQPETTYEPNVPAYPTTMVYTVEAPAATEPGSATPATMGRPGTFKVQGHSMTLTKVSADEELLQGDPMELLLPVSDTGYEEGGYSTEMSVMEATTCSGITERMPVDAKTEFGHQDGRVWCYAQVGLYEGATGVIQHVWRYQGKEMLRVAYVVEGPNYRTSSFKSIDETAVGDWTVELTTENGEVLDVLAFQVN